MSRVTSRLVTALEEQDHHVVYGASWPPRSPDGNNVSSEREAAHARGTDKYQPSGTATSTFMPWRPATSNPLKKLESADWNLYVVDLVRRVCRKAGVADGMQPQLNAFALPSKDVFVYTGLLKTLPDDDAMLAAVLAHEIAHVAERHSVENLGVGGCATRGMKLMILLVPQCRCRSVRRPPRHILRSHHIFPLVSIPCLRYPPSSHQVSITDSAGVFINWLNDVVAERAYSRKIEMEADKVGLDLMAAAGYDPRAALDLWEMMQAVEADSAQAGHPVGMENKFALLRTHPTSEARQRALEKDMPGAMKLWREHLPRRPAPAVPKDSETT